MVFLSAKEKGNIQRKQIATEVSNLITEITQFLTDRDLSQPLATDNRYSPNEWFQKSVNYRRSTENIFVNRYLQRNIDLACKMRDLEVIDDEELKSFLWHLQPEGPVIEWIRKDLNK